MTNNALNNEALADFTVYGASGATRKTRIENTNNTGSSNAISQIYVGGTSADDPFCRHVVGTSHSYALGIDNSDSDKWKLTYSADETATPSSSDVILSADTSGRWRRPMTPLFEAYVSSSYNIASGGVAEPVECGTEVFDHGSNYNTGTYTFTCPITGTYFFNLVTRMSGVNATNDYGAYYIYSSTVGGYASATYFDPKDIRDGTSNVIDLTIYLIIYASANDTVIPYVISEEVEQIGQDKTQFSGYLLG